MLGSSDTKSDTLEVASMDISDPASLQKLSWLNVELCDKVFEKEGIRSSEVNWDLTEELLVKPDLVLTKKELEDSFLSLEFMTQSLFFPKAFLVLN